MIQFALYAAPGGPLIADYSHKIQGANVCTNNRGFAEASGFIPLSLQESFRFYDRAGLPHVLFSSSSSGAIYEGRLEDVDIVNGGVNVRAFGYSRALSDTAYTALWSTTDPKLWRPMTTNDAANRNPDKYNIDFNGRIYLSTKKNQTYANGLDLGSVVFVAPDTSRQIVGFSFDYTINLPNPTPSWQFGYIGWLANFTATSAVALITNTAGVAFNRTVHVVIAACDALELRIYNNTGAANTPAGEDGANFLQILNMRVVTTTTNRVNTTLGTAFGAGGVHTVTPGSMANIYVGQQLQIDQGLNTSETVIVTAVTATTFTANYAIGAGHLATATVNAHVVYADEITKDLVSAVSTLNSTQLSSSTGLIQSPATDLTNELYEDRLPSDILDYLVKLGDNQSPPRQWEWGVYANRLLYFRPQNSANRTWYIDVSDIDIQRTIESLFNSVYATYKDAYNRTLRTSINTDSYSPTRYGLTRRKQITVPTTSSAQAGIQRDATLQDGKDPKPRSGLTIKQVFDANGNRRSLFGVDAGDTVVIRSLAPTLSIAIDRIRIFRIARTEYHCDDDTLTIEPESPLPTLEALLALALPSGAGFRGKPFIAPT